MELFNIGKKIIIQLKNNGHQAFFVGGAVRDLLLKRTVHDIDIATSALPEEVSQLFKKVIPTGLKHGTVTVIVDKIPFEVTTFRKEGNYTDFRHPEQVFFVNDLEEDLGRRDFTMNAMAMDENQQIVDPFHGQVDLNQATIRTVGNAKERFLEDPLRMLRAVRFATQLQFTIEDKTWKAMVEYASYVQNIAMERIKQEMDKILEAKSPKIGIELLYQSHLVQWIEGLKQSALLYVDVISIAKLMEQTENVVIRWAIWLHSITQEEQERVMQQLKMSKKESKQIKDVLLIAKSLKSPTTSTLKKCLITSNSTICLLALELNNLVGYIDDREKIDLTVQLKKIDSELKVRKTSDLAVSGKELAKYFELPSGPWIKKLLEQLLEEVIFDQLENEHSQLLLAAKRLKGEEEYEG